ncbi:hypothetical protein [Pseudomonas oryzihabitans]|uniref:hypothetical protein n=1 Tax=Pseudomonas oryzihabitans TaxID=47885 RepID=UPI0019287B8E|nr:hypothetical protein [Pseudomonas oryzihabitans]
MTRHLRKGKRMNRHFKRKFDDRLDLPQSVFGRVDHVVTSGPPANIVLIAIDAIDIKWLSNQAKQDKRFDIDSPMEAAAAWQRQGLPKPNAPSIFESAPLFRIEIELDAGKNPFGLPFLPDYNGADADTGAQALENAWFKFEVSLTHRIGFTPALIYPGLFATPIPAFVQGMMPTPVHAKALAEIFSLQHFPKISKVGLKATFKGISADMLAVYDVGQGNANALLRSRSNVSCLPLPALYFDLGAGVYRNKHTTPTHLQFCFSLNPPILLSHWDADHWAGAYATRVGNPPIHSALLRTWIAPLQTVGPLHVVFANEIIAQGGSLFIYNPAPGTVDRISLPMGTELRLALGTGSGRNDTGIAATIERKNLNPSRTWLLTGDCNYMYIEPLLAPTNPIAVVVPHHGANLKGGAAAPNPFRGANGYCRLIYSFGPDNAHGATGVRHPTLNAATLNIGSGWAHGAWQLPAPANTLPNHIYDVRATARHTVAGAAGANLGGILVGWNGIPAVFNSPCGGRFCTTTPVLD